jgi:hypothetical protein
MTVLCEACGGQILEVPDNRGGWFDAEIVAQETKEQYGMPLCGGCEVEFIRERASRIPVARVMSAAEAAAILFTESEILTVTDGVGRAILVNDLDMAYRLADIAQLLGYKHHLHLYGNNVVITID